MELHTAITPSRCSLQPSFFHSPPHPPSTKSPPIKTSIPFSRFNFFPKLQTPTRGRGLRPCNCGASQEDNSNDVVDDNRVIRACDKLIDVFLVYKPTPTHWRILLSVSGKWNITRPHFFARCKDRADSETNPTMKEKLLRFARKLKEVDEDVQRHNDLLDLIRKDPSEISNIVSKRRKDFTNEFFGHLYAVIGSYHDDAEKQNELVKLKKTCLAAVKAYDGVTESVEQINAAHLKLQDIINSPSLDAACRKIDNLAKKKELDLMLVLMFTKAWAAAKGSNMIDDEAKDILFHLYKTSVANLPRQIPRRILRKIPRRILRQISEEIRIIKHVIQIEDPEEQLSALNDAFTPGEKLEGTYVDNLHVTPEKLHMAIKALVYAYHLSKEGRNLRNPTTIEKLEKLKKIVERNFM